MSVNRGRSFRRLPQFGSVQTSAGMAPDSSASALMKPSTEAKASQPDTNTTHGATAPLRTGAPGRLWENPAADAR